MSVSITLLSYQNFTLQLPKEALLRFFPESLLAQTAQDYGDTFEMTNPLITPESLKLIQSLLLQGNLPAQSPPDVYSLLPAWHYLNLPPLNLMAEPYYALFRVLRPEINLLLIKPVLEDVEMYHELLKEAISNGAPVFAQYYIENAPENNDVRAYNDHFMVFASYLGQAEIVEIFLRRGFDPVTAKLNPYDRNIEHRDVDEWRIQEDNNQALHYACLYGHTSVVQVLLASAKITTVTQNALQRARNSDNFMTWYVVAMNPKTTAEALNAYAQTMAAELPELRVLLSRPEFDPTADRYRLFKNMVNSIESVIGDVETINEIDTDRIFPDTITRANVLYFDPRTNPNAALQAVFDKYLVLPSDLTLPWITDPRFEGHVMTAWWFRSMVWLWPLKVLTEFLRRFRSPTIDTDIVNAYNIGLEINNKYGSDRVNVVGLLNPIDQLAGHVRNNPEAVKAILEANRIQT